MNRKETRLVSRRSLSKTDVGKRLFELAIGVFESVPKTLEWFIEPNRALGGQRPAEILQSDPEAVERVLQQIEHGIIS